MVSVVSLSKKYPSRVLECLERQAFRDFEIVHAKEKGIVNAMNKALARAKGDIFVRIDDDVEMPDNWLENLVKPFDDPQVAGVTGPTFVPLFLRENRDSIRWAETPHPFLNWLYDSGKFAPAGIR